MAVDHDEQCDNILSREHRNSQRTFNIRTILRFNLFCVEYQMTKCSGWPFAQHHSLWYSRKRVLSKFGLADFLAVSQRVRPLHSTTQARLHYGSSSCLSPLSTSLSTKNDMVYRCTRYGSLEEHSTFAWSFHCVYLYLYHPRISCHCFPTVELILDGHF